jgi:flagellar basal body rod protein FlgC
MEPLSIALAGVQAANALFEQAAAGVIRAATPPASPQTAAGADTVDLSAAMVSLLQARTSMEANVRAFQTADEMTRRVLDVLG